MEKLINIYKSKVKPHLTCPIGLKVKLHVIESSQIISHYTKSMFVKNKFFTILKACLLRIKVEEVNGIMQHYKECQPIETLK